MWFGNQSLTLSDQANVFWCLSFPVWTVRCQMFGHWLVDVWCLGAFVAHPAVSWLTAGAHCLWTLKALFERPGPILNLLFDPYDLYSLSESLVNSTFIYELNGAFHLNHDMVSFVFSICGTQEE